MEMMRVFFCILNIKQLKFFSKWLNENKRSFMLCYALEMGPMRKVHGIFVNGGHRKLRPLKNNFHKQISITVLINAPSEVSLKMCAFCLGYRDTKYSVMMPTVRVQKFLLAFEEYVDQQET
jgi:hypothetical protein